MGIRLGSAQGPGVYVRLWLPGVAAVVLVILTLEANRATGASPQACQVRNAESGKTYGRLQQAVNAAKPGAHLIVKGTCRGTTTIDKSLAIMGVTRRRTGKPVLDGDDKARVLTIKPKVTVNLRGGQSRGGGVYS